MKTGAKKANPNNGRSFILASGSPRRKELLKDLVSDFRVITSEAQEIQFHENGPISLVEENARLKADSVALDYPFDWVLGADTLVFYKERILGKPKDMDGAYAIQTRSDLIIEKFVGSFSNIVGLPIEGLRELFLTLPKMEK